MKESEVMAKFIRNSYTVILLIVGELMKLMPVDMFLTKEKVESCSLLNICIKKKEICLLVGMY